MIDIEDRLCEGNFGCFTVNSMVNQSTHHLVASTNRVNEIDPTLQRPVCFNAEIEVSTPNNEEYFEIHHLHSPGENFDDGHGRGSIQYLT